MKKVLRTFAIVLAVAAAVQTISLAVSNNTVAVAGDSHEPSV